MMSFSQPFIQRTFKQLVRRPSISQFIYQAVLRKDWTLDDELLISSYFTFGGGAKAEVNENRLSALGVCQLCPAREVVGWYT